MFELTSPLTGAALAAKMPAPSLPNIGCRRDAVAAIDGTLRELGSGAFRTVYSGRGGKVVYKLAHRDNGDGDRNADNESEYVALTTWRVSGATWAPYCAIYYVRDSRVVATTDGTTELPSADLTDGARAVLCMRAFGVDGSDWKVCDSYERNIARRGIDLPDMHAGNRRGTPAKRVRITDLGRIVWGW